MMQKHFFFNFSAYWHPTVTLGQVFWINIAVTGLKMTQTGCRGMANFTCTGGRGSEAKKVSIPKTDLQFRAALMNFTTLLRKFFLMWGRGDQAEPRLPFGPPSPPPPL